MTRSSIRAAFLGTVSALALVGTAQAGTMMETENFGFSRSISLGTRSFTQTVQFNQFDSGLGTLTGVQFDLRSSAAASATLVASGTGNVAISGTLGGTLEMDVVGLGGVESTSTGINVTEFCLTDGSVGVTGNCDVELTDDTLFDDTFMVSVGDFASFTGLGMFDVDLKATLTLTCTANTFNNESCDFENGSFVWGGTDLDPDFGVKVTYTYDPVTVAVPEPGTLALFGAGLFGMALLRRRRRVSRSLADRADGARR